MHALKCNGSIWQSISECCEKQLSSLSSIQIPEHFVPADMRMKLLMWPQMRVPSFWEPISCSRQAAGVTCNGVPSRYSQLSQLSCRGVRKDGVATNWCYYY